MGIIGALLSIAQEILKVIAEATGSKGVALALGIVAAVAAGFGGGEKAEAKKPAEIGGGTGGGEAGTGAGTIKTAGSTGTGAGSNGTARVPDRTASTPPATGRAPQAIDLLDRGNPALEGDASQLVET
jgi:hypothetical protein